MEQPTDLGTPAEKIRGLPADDVEVFVLGDLDVPRLGQLIELPFDHPQGDVAQETHEIERVVCQRQRHRLDVEVIPQKDGDVIAPAGVRRQPAPPHVGAVDDVVVHQRRGVDELHDRGVEHGTIAGIAAQARGHQQDGRPDAFASTLLKVAPHLGDERDARLDVLDEFLFDGFEILSNRFEDLGKIRGGRFLRCIAQGMRMRMARTHNTGLTRAVSTR